MHPTIQLLVTTRPIQLQQSTTPTLIAQVKGGPPGPGVDLLNTRGDLLTHDGSDPVRLPVGLDGQMLTANSTAPNGVVWNGVVVRRVITQDLTVQAGTTVLQRNPVIADGVSIIIEDGGEFLVL